MIYNERIRQARELKRLTQKALARVAGVTQATIAHIESGRKSPSAELTVAIAHAMDVDPTFFQRVPAVSAPIGSLSYRARSTASAVERKYAFQMMKVFLEQIHQMADRLRIPTLQLPTEESPTYAAHRARHALGINHLDPVPHLIHTLERHGVLVFSLPDRLESVDAFSTWVEVEGERPVVTLSPGYPGDRIRSSVAHELGHLIMHKGLANDTKGIEEAANQFAAEFLLPERAMVRLLPGHLTLVGFAQLKPVWKVSIQMLIRRARDLEYITERRYRYLCMQVGRNGWRKAEPINIPTERPRLYRQMAEMLYGSENKSRAGVGIGLSGEFAERLFDHYAPGSTAHKFLDTEQYYVGRIRHTN